MGSSWIAILGLVAWIIGLGYTIAEEPTSALILWVTGLILAVLAYINENVEKLKEGAPAA